MVKIEQRLWIKAKGWNSVSQSMGGEANLVFVFGETNALKRDQLLTEIQAMYPKAEIFGCSTAGEIQGAHVYDDTITTTAIQFKHTAIKSVSLDINAFPNSFEAGHQLAKMLDHRDLNHVLVLSVGLNVNGSQLVNGLTAALPSHVTMTGGLAGDKDRFQETLVISNGVLSNNMIAAVGLYGKNLKVTSASLGGWDSFGPERRVTKSKDNVLFELDHKSVLELYKTYLGDHAKDLPGSALLFPLSIRTKDGEVLVRTILSVDEKTQSLTFAGDIPEGAIVQLMRANFDRLIDGAIGAAEKSTDLAKVGSPELALLISCVGRKLVLKQRVEEEVEGVRDVFGDKTVLTGFYSYGEISPFTPSATCELHNQTMTITTLTEVDEKDPA